MRRRPRNGAGRDGQALEIGADDIAVDGVSFPWRPGRADVIDPGPHVVRVTRGKTSIETAVTINAGEKNQLVVIPWKAALTDESRPPTPRFDDPRTKRSIAPYVFVAIVAAGVVTTIVALVSADHHAKERDSLRDVARDPPDDDPAKKRLEQEAVSQRDAADTAHTVASVAGYSSLFVGGLGLCAYLSSTTGGKNVALAPAVGPTFGGLSFTRSF